jgi:uncharacterized protein
MKHYIIKLFFPLLFACPGLLLANLNSCHKLKPIKSYKGPKVSKFGVYHGYSKASYNSWIRESRYLTMPDGTKLAIDVIIPAKNCIKAKKRFPVILTQTPYQRVYAGPKGTVVTEVEDQGLQNLIRHGYVFSAVAIRGTAASFGRFHGLFAPIERKDISHVIEWLAKQPFSDGNIGMIGGSYQGITQFMAASQKPSHLKAIYPEVSTFDFYDFVYPGGIFRKDLITYWAQMTHNIDLLNQLIPVDNDPMGVQLMHAIKQHEGNVNVIDQLNKAGFQDYYTPSFSWLKNSPASLLKKINQAKIPVYISDGWYDAFISDALLWYANYDGPKKMLVGAWPHNTNGAPKALANVRQKTTEIEALRWFDYWLKGIHNGIMSEPPIHYDILTKDYLPNKWVSTKQWPPKEIAPIKLYLSKGHSLRKTISDKNAQVPDSYTINYTTTTGHNSRWGNVAGQGFINYNDLAYNDTKSLTYTSAPLKSNMTIVGFPIVTLYLSSSTNDVDIHVVLEEVDRQGFSHYLTEGMLRASQRKLSKAPWKNYGLPYQSHKKADVQLLRHGQIVKLRFYLYPFSRMLHKGSRIRIAIMGADMNNTNTLIFSKAPVIKLYHDKQYQSLIELPKKVSKQR